MAIQPSWLNRLFSVDTYNLSTSVQSSTNCDLFGIEDLDKALASAELIFSRVIDEVEHATFLDVLCMSLKAKASPRADATTDKAALFRTVQGSSEKRLAIHQPNQLIRVDRVQSPQMPTSPTSGFEEGNLPGSFPNNAKSASPSSLDLAPISLVQKRSTSVSQTLSPLGCPLDMIDERIAEQRLFSEKDIISLRKYFKQFETMVLIDFDCAIECLNEHEGQNWGVDHRYDDPTKLKLALAIAIYQAKHPKDEYCTREMLEIIVCVNKPGQLSDEHINECIEKMPSKNQIDHLVFKLASEPKGGAEWGKEHRYDDRNRLGDALLRNLENLCFPFLVQDEE